MFLFYIGYVGRAMGWNKSLQSDWNRAVSWKNVTRSGGPISETKVSQLSPLPFQSKISKELIHKPEEIFKLRYYKIILLNDNIIIYS